MNLFNSKNMYNKKLELSLDKALDAYSKASCEQKKLLEDLYGKDIFCKKIQDRVKSFEDALHVLGLQSNDVLPYSCPSSIYKIQQNAFAKLQTIARALNEGWIPDWSNKHQPKWRCWFDMSPFAFSDASYYRDGTSSASCLCLKNEELAIYFGKQFECIHKEYMI